MLKRLLLAGLMLGSLAEASPQLPQKTKPKKVVKPASKTTAAKPASKPVAAPAVKPTPVVTPPPARLPESAPEVPSTQISSAPAAPKPAVATKPPATVPVTAKPESDISDEPDAPTPIKKTVKKRKPTEETLIQPEVVYRTAGITLRKNSVYYKASESDNFADQVYVALNFSKTFDYRDQVVIVPAMRTKLKAKETEPFIEQGYIRSELNSYFELLAGKKNEVSGSGFLINPSDLLNEGRDFFDPLLQREGQIFTRITLRLGGSSLGLGFIPKARSSVEKGRAWLVAHSDVADFDINLQVTGSERDKFTLGLSVARFFGEHFELHFDGRHQNRQRSEEDYPERSFSAYKYEDVSNFFVAGSRVVITGKRSIVGEYVYQQSGLLPLELETLYEAEAEKDEEQRGEQIKRLLGRRFAFLAFIDEDSFKSTSITLSGTMNTDDGSAFGSLLLKYKLSPLSSLEFQPTFFSGKGRSEFGEGAYKYIYYGTFRGKF